MREKNEVLFIPYKWIEEYEKRSICVEWDDYESMYYVLQPSDGKKLYFPGNNKFDIERKYRDLIVEQDKKSPHFYFDKSVCNDAIFIDVGAAEGFIALSVIENCNKIILMECDSEWIRALEATFRPYGDKVVIINKYANYTSLGTNIRIDEIEQLEGISGKKIVIKMDIEGMELEALKGATRLFGTNECFCSCTTYHSDEAENSLRHFFEDHNFSSIECSDGYILFKWGWGTLLNKKYKRISYPYFRRGIIRASNFGGEIVCQK